MGGWRIRSDETRIKPRRISRRILNNNKATCEECWVAIDDDAASPGQHFGLDLIVETRAYLARFYL